MPTTIDLRPKALRTIIDTSRTDCAATMLLNLHLIINLHNILFTLHHLLNALFVASLLPLLIFCLSRTDKNFDRMIKIILVLGICLILYAAAMGRIANQMRRNEKSRKAWERAKKDTERATEAWREEKCAALSARARARARAEAAEKDANDAKACARAGERGAFEAITRLQGERDRPDYQRLVDENAQLREYVALVVAWAAANADYEN